MRDMQVSNNVQIGLLLFGTQQGLGIRGCVRDVIATKANMAWPFWSSSRSKFRIGHKDSVNRPTLAVYVDAQG